VIVVAGICFILLCCILNCVVRQLFVMCCGTDQHDFINGMDDFLDKQEAKRKKREAERNAAAAKLQARHRGVIGRKKAATRAEQVAEVRAAGSHTVVVKLTEPRELASGDKSGNSDPYAVFELVDQATAKPLRKSRKHKTKTVKKTLFPIWDEEFTWLDVRDTNSVAVKVTVYDAGTLSSDVLGGFSVPLSKGTSPEGTGAQWYPLEAVVKMGEHVAVSGSVRMEFMVTPDADAELNAAAAKLQALRRGMCVRNIPTKSTIDAAESTVDAAEATGAGAENTGGERSMANTDAEKLNEAAAAARNPVVFVCMSLKTVRWRQYMAHGDRHPELRGAGVKPGQILEGCVVRQAPDGSLWLEAPVPGRANDSLMIAYLPAAKYSDGPGTWTNFKPANGGAHPISQPRISVEVKAAAMPSLAHDVSVFPLCVGSTASPALRQFLKPFTRLAVQTTDAVERRAEAFRSANPKGSGACSLAELEGCVLQTLLDTYPKEQSGQEPGRDLFDLFRPCYVKAFNDAKNYKADSGKVLEIDDFVSESEFHLYNVYLCIYAAMVCSNGFSFC
jgi:hypothetical protein